MPRRGRNVTTKNFAQVATKWLASEAETKYHVKSLSSTLPDTSSALVTDLTGIATGDGVSSREGNEIFVKSINARMRLDIADTWNYIRVLMFTWSGSDTPTVADILESTSGGHEFLCSYEPDRTTPFHVFVDKTVRLDVTTPTRIVNLSHRFKKPLKVTYDATASNSYGDKQIWMIAFSDSGAVAHPTYVFRSTTRFYDV